MKLFVHIGTHKTGTSAIQNVLRRYSRSLADADIYIPVTGTLGVRTGHHNIGWGLREDPRFKPEYGDLEALIDELAGVGMSRAVISSEDLEYMADQPEKLSRFDDELRRAGNDPHYILFIRRPDTYAESLYAELCSHGLSITFNEFVSEVLRRGKFLMNDDWSFHFDPSILADKWRAATRSPLYVLSYDGAQAKDGVVPTFMRFIGAPEPIVATSLNSEIMNPRKPVQISNVQRLVAGWRLRRTFLRSLDPSIFVDIELSP